MPQSNHLTALDINYPETEALPEDMQKYFKICQEKLGLVPNVLLAYRHNPDQFRGFSRFYNALMLGESGLSKLEREMIAVVVSSNNHCFYCQTAHGASVREYASDPVFGELMVMNYRAAELSERHRAMLDFAVKVTESSHKIGETDRQSLRDAGFSDEDIFDIANVAAFFNMSNRVANAIDMQPNGEYHHMHR